MLAPMMYGSAACVKTTIIWITISAQIPAAKVPTARLNPLLSVAPKQQKKNKKVNNLLVVE